MFSEDDDDFSLAGKSKLSSLFNLDQRLDESNNSLTYTAPRQPRKHELEPETDASASKPSVKNMSQGSAMAVKHATAVHCFKFIDGHYKEQGKLGAAIIGNDTTGEHKLLLYIKNQKPIAQASITTNFAFTVQPNNYASFYDTQGQNWCILGDNEDHMTEFAKQIGLARANSSSTVSTLITQDLRIGNGHSLVQKDSAELKYSGWLFTDRAFGKLFDSNSSTATPFIFKIGSRKVIKGWDEGIKGMKSGGKRMLIIPPHLGYGEQGMANRIPPGSTLIFQLEVVGVKSYKDTSKVDAKSAESETVEEKPRAESIKERTASLTEQLSHHSPTSTDKAKLISRMAKMGHQMLPSTGASQEQDSDNEENDNNQAESAVTPPVSEPSSPPKQRPLLHPKPHKSVSGHLTTSQPSNEQTEPASVLKEPTVSASTYSSQIGIQQQPQPAALALYQSNLGYPSLTYVHPSTPVQQQTLYPQVPVQQQSTFPSVDPSLQIFMSESRNVNTELRLALGKVQDKLDNLTAKFDKAQYETTSQNQSAVVSYGLPPARDVDTVVLTSGIQRLVQENEKLKSDCAEKSQQMEKQNEKISSLIEKNHKLLENSHALMEQKNELFMSSNEQSHHHMITFQEEKLKILKDCAEAVSRADVLQAQLKQEQQTTAKLEEKLQAVQNELSSRNQLIGSLEVQLEDRSKNSSNFQQIAEDSEGKLQAVELEAARLNEALSAAKTELSEKLLAAKSENESLRNDLDKAEENVKRFQTSATKMQDDITDLRQQLIERTGELDRIREAKQVANNEAVKLKQNMDDESAAMEEKLLHFGSRVKILEDEKVKLELECEKYKSDLGKEDTIEQQDGNYDDGDRKVLKEKLVAAEAKAETWRQQALEAENTTIELQHQFENLGSENVLRQVKKVMNSVYHVTCGEFDSEEQYDGATVQSVLLKTIKTVTMRLLQQSSATDDAQTSIRTEKVAENVDSQISAGSENGVSTPSSQANDEVSSLEQSEITYQEVNVNKEEEEANVQNQYADLGLSHGADGESDIENKGREDEKEPSLSPSENVSGDSIKAANDCSLAGPTAQTENVENDTEVEDNELTLPSYVSLPVDSEHSVQQTEITEANVNSQIYDKVPASDVAQFETQVEELNTVADTNIHEEYSGPILENASKTETAAGDINEVPSLIEDENHFQSSPTESSAFDELDSDNITPEVRQETVPTRNVLTASTGTEENDNESKSKQIDVEAHMSPGAEHASCEIDQTSEKKIPEQPDETSDTGVSIAEESADERLQVTSSNRSLEPHEDIEQECFDVSISTLQSDEKQQADVIPDLIPEQLNDSETSSISERKDVRLFGNEDDNDNDDAELGSLLFGGSPAKLSASQNPSHEHAGSVESTNENEVSYHFKQPPPLFGDDDDDDDLDWLK